MAGAVLRFWGLPRLGLSHFDEGIYAIAGLWSVSPGGLASLDPTLIPYAPPGFPILVGVAYRGLGVSDLAAILVSILAGTLTIPAAAWLARRTCGAGAGAAAAALVAFSGFHVAFSRVALTDASFLLCWIPGLVCGQRFLERPRFSSAIALGLSVGLVQWFKYNGWLLGVFVVLAACLGILVDPKERHRPRMRAVWGFGLLAVLLAVAVYWPWFAFVESHGGYAGLLKHHQSYMGGFSSWPPHLRLQLAQMAALSGGPAWNVTECLAAVLCCKLVLLPLGKPNRYRASLLRLAFFALGVLLFPYLYWWLGAAWVLDPRQRWSPGKRLLAAAWLGLSILTPFYHPYARLWLPLHFLGWIMTANLINEGFPTPHQKPGRLASVLETGDFFGINIWECIACGIALLAIELLGPDMFGSPTLGPGELPGPLAPSDLLRSGVRKAVADLPAGTPGLRLLARPPVTFYLGGRVQVQVEPDLARLLAPGNPGHWALVDLAQLRQEGDPKTASARLLSLWELVREYPVQLGLPALLDIDPGAARAGRSESSSAPLWLLRPRTAGTA
ncbi:MAG TPA: glycosyltransferase family 39 protein [Isosphaeraceae bacterium]|nr:glycosyltransferase family 39 protein [Isosphaeraceae bacterium]